MKKEVHLTITDQSIQVDIGENTFILSNISSKKSKKSGKADT